jgi:phosphoribosylformimino-5-aminoimidazole carboxamide ribonucleotide (ProFAR) isomerase
VATVILYPAIDLKEGRCVVQGDRDQAQALGLKLIGNFLRWRP